MMPPPKLIMGSLMMDYSPSDQEKDVGWYPVMEELGIKVLDVSPAYPPGKPRLAEHIVKLGGLNTKLTIDSKIAWSGNGDGSMTLDAISQSVEGSLAAIGNDKLHILSCEHLDNQTPISEQAAAVDALYRAQKFEKFAVCDFPAQVLEEWLQVADTNGYVKPSIYQGHYNLLCRTYEETLFPLLRKHRIHFSAYSPLGGGFLRGKVTFAASEDDMKGTRLESGTKLREMWDKPAMNDAIRKIAELGKPHDINVADVAWRWLIYHSQLDGGPILKDDGDTVIIGPRSPDQLKIYEEMYCDGPLPDDVLEELDALWEGVKEDARAIVGW